jgi:hypothetical protein
MSEGRRRINSVIISQRKAGEGTEELRGRTPLLFMQILMPYPR